MDRLNGVSGVLVIVVGVAAVLAAACSLTWRMGVDVPVMMYLSERIVHHGAVPYRDFFDMNLPGSYWMYGAVVWLLGTTDLAANVANLLVMLTAGTTFFYAFGRGRPWMLFGVGIVALLVFSRGVEFVLQREMLAMVPIAVLSVLALGGWRRPGVVGRAAMAGMCLAVLTLIKPQFLLYGAVPVFLVIHDARRGIGVCKASTVLAVAFSLPLAAAVFWLVRNQAWDAFLEVVRYWGLYGELTRFHVMMLPAERYLAVLDGVRMMILSPFTAVAVVSLAYAWFKRTILRRELVVWVGLLIAAVLVPTVSGQFWAYHRLPFFCLTLFTGGYLLAGREWYALAAAGLLAVSSVAVSGRGVWRETTQSSVERDRLGIPDRFAEYLKVHMKEGDTVQPIDWARGALYGMLQVKAPLATRYPYTFYFHHHVSHPFIQKIRSEFLDELAHCPPRFLLEPFKVNLPTGVDTEKTFQAFEEWRNVRYHVAEQGDEYRIWERND